ncbi:MAG: hypothetical protein MUF54_08420 [Polyangiaceae bacterium]|jgi:hypothetical protein|nr:hypothetical protein [Polyangiaceae bacterium]
MKASTWMAITLVPIMLTTAAAFALPRSGQALSAAMVQTLDGKTLDTRNLQGKITLIFYEDKDTTQQNRALKDALIAQKKSPGRRDNVRIYGVADVSSWDFWPAKGFVTDAIRKQEQQSGNPIYCDWSGDFGRALGATPNNSNVVLIGPDGKVKLALAGPLPSDTRQLILSETGK